MLEHPLSPTFNLSPSYGIVKLAMAASLLIKTAAPCRLQWTLCRSGSQANADRARVPHRLLNACGSSGLEHN